MLTRLVEDLQTLALADAGEIKLIMTDTDLEELVRRVVERFQPQAISRQVSLNINHTKPCPPLSVDPGRIEQILGNLLSNALRYTPIDGRIVLTLDCQPHQTYLHVHDSGPGIPPDAMTHVFERFYRADKSRSRLEGGTGLGLVIARKLAEVHGGNLNAANHPVGGAVFTLILPNRIQ